MSETKKWVAITEDRNGGIQIFHKWIDEEETWTIKAFQHEVEAWNVKILIMFREDAVTMVCGL